jgi:ankyrin repeat protein
LQEEDVDTAIRAYTATRADYEAWLVEEELRREEERQREEEARLVRHKEKRATQHAAFKNLGLLRFGRSTCNTPTQSRRRSKQDIAVSAQTLEEPIPTEDDYPLLQKEMSPSEEFVADDFRSPHDSYEQEQSTTEQQTYKNYSRRKKSKGFRLAGFRVKDELESSEEDDEDPGTDELFTTPLHEAARLGSGKLVRLFLEHGGRPNERNGKQRTSLHMAAGGLTAEEQDLWIALLKETQPKDNPEVVEHDVGIRAPCIIAPHFNQETEQHSGGAKKAAMAISRFLKLGNHSSEKDHEAVERKKTLPAFDANRFHILFTQRMDAVLAIMAWCHPEDGSAASGEGPSINSVDRRGRTALHYAAELGRSDICMAIVSSFGAILTIVDESSRTPCELAGERLHYDLAAQLEARALLYFDPSGVEDELLASILADERNDDSLSRKRLAPPFSWFETLDSAAVRQLRNEITEAATVKMQEILNSCQVQKEANEVMFSYNVNDSLDSVPQADIGVVDERVSDRLETDAFVEETVDRTCTPQTHAPDESSRDNDNAATNVVTSGSESAPDESSNRHENPAVKLDSNASEYTFIRESLQESHVDRFLAFHGWGMEQAMADFNKDPIAALGDAGVPVVMHKSLGKSEEVTTQTCLICCDEFAPDAPEWRELQSCTHGFCVQCLGDYIADCASSKTCGITVFCPHHQCTVPMTPDELQSLAPALWESLLGVADENFVASSENLKFCPHPGCTGVVQRLVPAFISEEGFDHDIIDVSGAVCVMLPEGAEDKDAPLTYEGVRDKRYVLSKGLTQPHMAHRFCFSCGAESVHWPIPCEKLEEWKKKVREEVADEDEGEDGGNYQDVAQRLWIKANTRPCPQVC